MSFVVYSKSYFLKTQLGGLRRDAQPVSREVQPTRTPNYDISECALYGGGIIAPFFPEAPNVRNSASLPKTD